MTVQFEDVRCTALSGFCDNAVCELLEDTIVAVVVRLRKIAFGGILPEAQVKSFLRKRLRCKRNITETFTVGKLPKHQDCELVPARKKLDVTISVVFV